ncbi:MAG: hypothetical protein ACWGSQ_18675 [Longimicrobiales bacterium]
MRRFRGVSSGVLASALVLGLAGCASGGGTQEEGTTATEGQGVRLTVSNQQRTEAEIWVFVDGSRQRMGVVRSNDTNNFLIRMDRGRNLRMEFRIFGGPTCVTRDVQMVPGEAVSYTIPVNIQMFDAVCR